MGTGISKLSSSGVALTCILLFCGLAARGVLRDSGLSAQAQTAVEDPSAQTIAALSREVQAHPGNVSARLELARAYAVAGEDGQAEAQYKNALQLAPQNAVALAAFGAFYEGTGHLDKAEPLLAHAAKASRDPEIRTEWATVLARLHRYQDASHALAGVAPPSSREERIGFYRLKAAVSSGLGNAVGAASAMESALALSPDDPGLVAATAAAQLQAKNWHRSAELAEPVFSRTHDPGVGLMLLEAQFGEHADVRSTLESLDSLSMPADQELNFRQRLAEVLLAHGRSDESVAELKRVVELAPDRADLIYDLALAQFKANQLDDALSSAEKAKALADSADTEALLGDIEEARGDNLVAVRSYQQAVALSPDEEKYRLALAVDLIRHKSFEPAEVVLKQAQASHPDSWRVLLALGMVESFSGTMEQAANFLLRAADLAPEPEVPLSYLGGIEVDQESAPVPVALARLCQYADRHPQAGKIQFYCGALTFRRDYASGDKSHVAEILRRLRTAEQRLPKDASPHCELGKAYRWAEQWTQAKEESEACVRLNPESAEAHYRLAQIYQHFGMREQSQEEMKTYMTASQRQQDENTRRAETMKTFLYTIEKPVEQK